MNKELTIEDIHEIVAKDESRYLEFKQTTGELYKAMTSACAYPFQPDGSRQGCTQCCLCSVCEDSG